MYNQFSPTMEAEMDKHSSYMPEYKLEAVRLARTEGISDTARNLSINPNMLGRCKNTKPVQHKPAPYLPVEG